MLAPPLQRRMTLLALVAMALLLVVPIAGRVLSATSTGQDGVWAQMCTMAGLKLVKIAPADASPLDLPAPKLPAGMPDGGDCPYCPLLGGLVVLLLCLAFVVPSITGSTFRPWRLIAPRAFLHPSGLGSRGPPMVLCKA